MVDAVSSRYDTHASAQPVTWLSGEVVTFLNKIGPVIWVAMTAGVLSGVLLKTGRLFIAPSFLPGRADHNSMSRFETVREESPNIWLTSHRHAHRLCRGMRQGMDVIQLFDHLGREQKRI